MAILLCCHLRNLGYEVTADTENLMYVDCSSKYVLMELVPIIQHIKYAYTLKIMLKGLRHWRSEVSTGLIGYTEQYVAI
jgi:hypothetical protein